MRPPEDKRKAPRFDVELPAQVGVGTAASGRPIENPLHARIDNLSMGGARLCVALPEPPRIGQRVEVSFEVPLSDGAAPLRATAEIRWISDVDSDWLGVQFVTGFRAREAWALGQFLK